MSVPTRQNPRTLALRYRAYVICRAHDGNLTAAQLAEAMDVPEPRLRRALRGEKWAMALRSSTLDMPIKPEFQATADIEDQIVAKAFIGVAA